MWDARRFTHTGKDGDQVIRFFDRSMTLLFDLFQILYESLRVAWNDTTLRKLKDTQGLPPRFDRKGQWKAAND